MENKSEDAFLDELLEMLNAEAEAKRKQENRSVYNFYKERHEEWSKLAPPVAEPERMHFTIAFSLLKRKNCFLHVWSYEDERPRFPRKRRRTYEISSLARENHNFNVIENQKNQETNAQQVENDEKCDSETKNEYKFGFPDLMDAFEVN